jgi:sulfatase modifying factor 1
MATMKSKKKTPPSPAKPSAPASVALSPRQAALRKLYRFLKISGAIAVTLTVAVVGTLYGERLLYPFGRKRLTSGKEIVFREPKLNPITPPGPAPEGMVWIPGGEFYMGSDIKNEFGQLVFEDAAELHLVYVDGFWMDKHEVTNEQYARFVAATGYVTDAEKRPDPKEFPDAPLKDLKPFSIVFKKPGPNDEVDLRDHLSWWDRKYGASWKHPEGSDSTIKGRENYPVVHISYNDALAYCQWADKRLPTEAEWEFAARGGLDRKIFPWGDELKPDDKWMANVWQGKFPQQNTKEDGFEGLAPVGSFPPNGYGLYDMAGNAWEWCADWYQVRYYEVGPERNPQGPDSGSDPMEPGVPKRVQRGGSFLCDERYCMRYVAGARGKGEVTSAANHIGFRCVMNPPGPTPAQDSDLQEMMVRVGLGAIIVLCVCAAALWGWRRFSR